MENETKAKFCFIEHQINFAKANPHKGIKGIPHKIWEKEWDKMPEVEKLFWITLSEKEELQQRRKRPQWVQDILDNPIPRFRYTRGKKKNEE